MRKRIVDGGVQCTAPRPALDRDVAVGGPVDLAQGVVEIEGAFLADGWGNGNVRRAVPAGVADRLGHGVDGSLPAGTDVPAANVNESG